MRYRDPVTGEPDDATKTFEVGVLISIVLLMATIFFATIHQVIEMVGGI